MNKNVLNMLSSHAPSPRRKFSQFISERDTLFLCSLFFFFFSLSFALPCKKETITKKTQKKIESLRQNKTNRERRGEKRACYLNYAQKTQKPRLKKEKKTVFILSLTCLVQTVFGEIRILLLLLIACANTVADGFCRPPPTPTPLPLSPSPHVCICMHPHSCRNPGKTDVMYVYLWRYTTRPNRVCVGWGKGGRQQKVSLIVCRKNAASRGKKDTHRHTNTHTHAHTYQICNMLF